MATRPQSVFKTEHVFFETAPQSIDALKTTNLELYCHSLPTFPTILAELKEQGLFLDKVAVDYSMQDFLKQYFETPPSNLNQSPFQLLTEPLSLEKLSLDTLPESEDYPEPFLCIAQEINCYIAMICDVLDNQLSQEPYEESVSERVHALQAGKFSYLLGMPLEDVIALLLHDIARPSIKDNTYGHSHHCREGSTILSPLGLLTDYSGTHAFAKHLLYKPGSLYSQLISDTSKRTLKIQSVDWSSQLGTLNTLDSLKLAFETYKIKFMRIIDDLSKVSTSELKKRLDGAEPEYFDTPLIAKMLRKQIATHLKQLMVDSKKEGGNIREIINDLKKKFDAAILLLVRAESKSYHPELYEKYHQMIESMTVEASQGAQLV